MHSAFLTVMELHDHAAIPWWARSEEGPTWTVVTS